VLEARKSDRLDGNAEWLGIVTDGARWCKWPKDYAARGPGCVLWDGRRLTEGSEPELSRMLRRSGGRIGLPDDPETVFDGAIGDLEYRLYLKPNLAENLRPQSQHFIN